MENAKIAPHSVESEQSLLGCIIIDNKTISGLNLPSQAMYDKRHEVIYRAMLDLYAKNVPIDLVTLSDFLCKHDLLEKVGGRSYLVQLTQVIPMISSAGAYADIIIDKYNRRMLNLSLLETVDALYDESKKIENTTEKLKQTLIGFSDRKYFVAENPEMADEWLADYTTPKKPRIETGMDRLDSVLGGLAGSELMLVIAKSNIGKTTFLLNMALNMANAGKKVLFFSLEMGVNELISKLISINSGHNAFQVYTREYNADALAESVVQFQGLPLSIAHRGAITSKDVMAEAHNRVLAGKVDVIMVDYLQRLSDESREGSVQRLTDIVRNLKNTANILGVPIITPVQIDKVSAKSGSRELEDISGAKAIGDDGDIALYLYEQTEKKSITEGGDTSLRCQIVKARNSHKYDDFLVEFDRRTLKMTIK